MKLIRQLWTEATGILQKTEKNQFLTLLGQFPARVLSIIYGFCHFWDPKSIGNDNPNHVVIPLLIGFGAESLLEIASGPFFGHHMLT